MSDEQKSLMDMFREAHARATKQEIEDALRAATRYIDGLPFKGVRKTRTQSLAWPRSGVIRPDGTIATGVPPEVLEASHIVTGMLLAGISYSVEVAALIEAVLKPLLQEGAKVFEGPVSFH